MKEFDQEWTSLFDYAKYYDISVSTVRRYIKANKLVYRQQKGKYYIKKEPPPLPPSYRVEDRPSYSWEEEKRRLEETIQEGKMLIQLYENILREKGLLS